MIFRRSKAIVRQHLSDLSHACALQIADDYSSVIVQRVRIPAGYNASSIDVLLELRDYPDCPPGFGKNAAYVPASLRYGRSELNDLHPARVPSFSTPGFGPWAWWCYRVLQWDSRRDNLIRFLEMMRADFINPTLK